MNEPNEQTKNQTDQQRPTDAPEDAVPTLVAVCVGLPRSLTEGAGERPQRTAFYKDPVAGPVWLSRLGLSGDGQVNRKYHGGPERAVLAYAVSHYRRWREELGMSQLGPAGFGENFAVAGQDEGTVYIGDRFAVGEAVVQVTQPRGPCQTLARCLGVADLVKRVRRTGHGGWYLRVLQEGMVAAGQRLVLLERPYPQWSVSRVAALRYGKPKDPQAVRQLLKCPLLSPPFAAELRRTL